MSTSWSVTWKAYSLFWFHSPKIALPSKYCGHSRSDVDAAFYRSARPSARRLRRSRGTAGCRRSRSRPWRRSPAGNGEPGVVGAVVDRRRAVERRPARTGGEREIAVGRVVAYAVGPARSCRPGSRCSTPRCFPGPGPDWTDRRPARNRLRRGRWCGYPVPMRKGFRSPARQRTARISVSPAPARRITPSTLAASWPSPNAHWRKPIGSSGLYEPTIAEPRQRSCRAFRSEPDPCAERATSRAGAEHDCSTRITLRPHFRGLKTPILGVTVECLPLDTATALLVDAREDWNWRATPSRPRPTRASSCRSALQPCGIANGCRCWRLTLEHVPVSRRG